MATPVLIPISEYLNTTYRPDCDYVDGELLERNMGERPHATIQGFFVASFYNQRRLWRVLALPEQRVQVSETRYRIADVCVVNVSDSMEPIVRQPPLLCIEIISRDQNLADMHERVQDYLAMGVENIWIVDPKRREAWLGTREGFKSPAEAIFSIEHTPIRIAIADIFAELENMEAGRL